MKHTPTQTLGLLAVLSGSLLLGACNKPNQDAPAAKPKTSNEVITNEAVTNEAVAEAKPTEVAQTHAEQEAVAAIPTTAEVNNNTNDNTTNTASAVGCDDSSQNITLTGGSFSQSGTITGYHYCEYLLPATAGQTLSVDLSGGDLGLDAIVFSPDAHNFTDAGDYPVTADGNITLRVLLTRNAARKHEKDAVPFSVNITAK